MVSVNAADVAPSMVICKVLYVPATASAVTPSVNVPLPLLMAPIDEKFTPAGRFAIIAACVPLEIPVVVTGKVTKAATPAVIVALCAPTVTVFVPTVAVLKFAAALAPEAVCVAVSFNRCVKLYDVPAVNPSKVGLSCHASVPLRYSAPLTVDSVILVVV